MFNKNKIKDKKTKIVIKLNTNNKKFMMVTIAKTHQFD